jgi:hypothetical protein
VANRSHRFGGDSGQVGHSGTRLVDVDLLQGQHICVDAPHALSQAVQVDDVVISTAPVQNVEGRYPHGYYLPTMDDDDHHSGDFAGATHERLRAALRRAASALGGRPGLRAGRKLCAMGARWP